jgi:hypothetical protein
MGREDVGASTGGVSGESGGYAFGSRSFSVALGTG